MTDDATPGPSKPNDDEINADDRTSDPIGDLLLRAMETPPVPKRSFLPSIQQRIRIRTKGRYYRDRFSRADNPVSFLLMGTLLVLILAAALFLAIQPLVDAPSEKTLQTPPVDLLEAPEGPGTVAPKSGKTPSK